ncbi:MAG: hypothetical protein WAT93_07555 [Pontixanthobacter sp.]
MQKTIFAPLLAKLLLIAAAACPMAGCSRTSDAEEARAVDAKAEVSSVGQAQAKTAPATVIDDDPDPDDVPEGAFPLEKSIAMEFPDVARSDINVLTADLNGDGQAEYLIGITDPKYCGTGGCTLFIFEDGAQDWRQVGRIPAVRPPYGVLPAKTGGWNDLFITLGGGGGPSGPYRLHYIDEQYGPSKEPPAAEPIGDPDVIEKAVAIFRE